MTNESMPVRPEPLSIYKLNGPEVVLKWQAQEAAYWTAVRAAEREATLAHEAEKAYANRQLTPAESFAEAQKRENQQRKRELERETERFAAKQQRLEALAATPHTAEILTPQPVQFLEEFEHWVRRGYSVQLDGPLSLQMNLFHLTLKAPSKKSLKGCVT